MSGGSYEYICYKIEEIELSGKDKSPRRAAFQRLLKKVAEAMHDIEWVDSYDKSPGDENEAIDECFKLIGDDPIIIGKALAFDTVALLVEAYKTAHQGPK
jgi:hypothetical protein